MRILLLEDEDSIRSALARAFERDGHEVRQAAALAEAASILSGWSPELAVSDLKLPDGNGLDLVGALGVPIIMLSGYATYDDAVRALRCGAVDFFTKPVSIKDVRAAIARINRSSGRPQGVSWIGPDEALAAVRELVASLPGRRARLAAVELVQAAPAGRLMAQVDAAGCRLWLDAAVDWDGQADRIAWLHAVGVETLLGKAATVVNAGQEPASSYASDLERLWPEELVHGRAVRAAGWVSCGSWILASVRAGAGPLVGLDEQLRRCCEACGVSISTAPASLIQEGVGVDERAGLFADDGLGSPLA